METDRGSFHHDPAWTYMVGHAEEAERGLDANSDLFSPGWFEVPLEGAQQAVLTAWRKDAWKEDGDERAEDGGQRAEDRGRRTARDC